MRPFLDEFCIKCHQGEKAKAGVDFHPIQSESDALAAKELWKKTWSKLTTRAMPPPERPQPEDAARERVAVWIETTFGKDNPGRVTMRRLSKVEYRATIRDLVGIDFKAADDFPSDDVGYGFDNIGDVLSLPPILMEKYFDAAGRILDRAIITAEQRAPATKSWKGSQLRGPGNIRGDRHELYSQGEANVETTVKLESDYLVRFHVSGDQAGPDPVKMAIVIDNERVADFDVKETRDKPAPFQARVRLKAGKHRLGAAFLNDYYMPGAANPADRDRNMIVHALDLEGPLDVALPASHRRIFVAMPGKDRPKEQAARDVIEAFASRAFRRPASEDEVARFFTLFEKADKQGDSFEQALKLPLRAILVSPHFLFRVETSEGALNDFELASRLSYFLWSSMPDEELFDLARAGRLRADLDAQVRRLLQDPRASALAENFATQWLQIRRIDKLAPDPSTFPQFDEDLRAAMLQEAVLFFESVVRENRSALNLLEANYTFLNERLAKHYGIEGVTGTQMRRIRLDDPRRGGILTMASVLSVTSNATRTSPAKRGKWVLETIFGAPPPPPIPDAGSLKEAATEEKTLSLRQRFERHRADVKCAPCHALMDPIGFGFENFDAVGVWRDRDEAGPVDTAATLPDGRSFSGPVELRRLILDRREDFARCLAEKLMTYGLGRGVEYYDGADLRAIVKAASEDGWRLSTMIAAVVKSRAFGNRGMKE